MMLKYDLIQDSQRMIALFGVGLSDNQQALIADGYILHIDVDEDSYFRFTSPTFSVVCHLCDGTLASKAGSVGWANEVGEGRLVLPVLFCERYESYAQFRAKNIEPWIIQARERKLQIAKKEALESQKRIEDDFEF